MLRPGSEAAPLPPRTLPTTHTHTHFSTLPVLPPSVPQAQYTRSSGATPDYLFLLQRLMMDNPEAAANLAKMVAKQVGCCVCGRGGGAREW